jgi:hypothetical protein
LAAIFDRRSPEGISGFELINDGCHPTIDGQILIAASLAEMIAGQRPELFTAPAADDLIARKEQWLEELHLTTGFLAQRTQELGFYLGFGYEDKMINDQAVKNFEDLKRLNPDSTLPELAIGLIRLRQGQGEAGRSALAAALELSMDHVQSMCQLYFKHYLCWQPPYLWVRARPGTAFHSILRDYLEATGVVAQGAHFSLPLKEADYIYRFDAATARLSDISEPIKARLKNKKQLLSAAVPNLTIYDPLISLYSVKLERISSQPDQTFIASGPDPALVICGLKVRPLMDDAAYIRADLSPAGGQVKGDFCLYWKSRTMAGFVEEYKTCAAVKEDREGKDYLFDLSNEPDWLLTDSVDSVRLDPSEGPIRLKLEKVAFIGAGAEARP